MKYYVTYYEEYPIYEPAEGGYYYAGVEMVDSEEFSSYELAREVFRQRGNEYGLTPMGQDWYIERSKYIGQERYLVFETEQGSLVRGKQVYS